MTVSVGPLVVLLALLMSTSITALVLANAAALGLVQIPNARSSHSRPTRTGGGLAIVVAGTLSGLALFGSGILQGEASALPFGAYALLGLLVASIGLWDDIRPLRAGVRLLVQIVAAAGTLAALPAGALAQASSLPLPDLLVLALAGLGGIYWINLFNFMDGIDGIAGSQACFMLFGAAGIALALGSPLLHEPLAWWMVSIGAACLGFLAFNWPPARIFMGDVGSTWLGYAVFALALHTIAFGWLPAPVWAILAAAFVSDASVTLLRRLLYGENLSTAHRRHAYQVLSRHFKAHRPVTLGYLALNVCVLLPLATFAAIHPAHGWTVAWAGYLVLFVVALLLGAGRREAGAIS